MKSFRFDGSRKLRRVLCAAFILSCGLLCAQVAAMYEVVTSDYVKVLITNSANADSCVERKFLKSTTIGDLKGKLEMLSGGNASSMKLEIYAKDSDKLVCRLEDDEALLGSFPVDDGMRLHIVDKFILRNSLNDESKVEKYDMPRDEYAKRSGTVREFLEKNRLGKYNEEERKKAEENRRAEEEREEQLAKSMKVGDRCEVKVANAPTRRASVMFVGKMEGMKGWFVGVKYDEPLGKNDGSVNGKRYFECPPKYGGFVRLSNVTVGDFPVEEFNLDEF